MNQMYHHIATISCIHPYFKDGSFRSIGFSASKDSSKLLHDLGVLIKPFPGGVHLLSAYPELLIIENNKNSIIFYLSCSDPYFINFTHLPDNYSPSKDVFYFNNLSTHISTFKKTYALQNSEFVDENDLSHLSNGTFEILDFDPTNTYTFHDAANNEIFKEHIIETFLNSGRYVITGLPEGLIAVKLENKVIQNVYYYPNAVWTKPLIIIELFTDTLYEHYKRNEKANYVVHYNNRSTIWKYFLTNPKFENFEDLCIINKKKVKVFGTPEKYVLSNNKQALVFSSDNEIPFQEYTDEYFLLVDKYVLNPNNENKIEYEEVINNLVKASPEQLISEKNQNEKITYYSHIYIH
jgi:hypothetical protein